MPSTDERVAIVEALRDECCGACGAPYVGVLARDMTPFDEAYKATDWSAFEHLPLFAAANRMNAYNTYLLMEHQPGP